MIAAIQAKLRPDGWAEWTDVYNKWDPQNIHPCLAGQAAQKVWDVLAANGLVEEQSSGGTYSVLSVRLTAKGAAI